MELAHGADGPPESFGGVAQVAHDEPVLPAALDGARPAQIRRRWGTIVDRSQSGMCGIINLARSFKIKLASGTVSVSGLNQTIQ